jgi:hypothetical protein
MILNYQQILKILMFLMSHEILMFLMNQEHHSNQMYHLILNHQ